MKVIAYSLFGFNEARKDNCFVFGDYLRGLHVNIRLARVLYPDWKIILYTDTNTFEGLKDILTRLPIIVEVCDGAELTKAMLWRLKPCFNIEYTHVLCRDLDSPLTYREAQAVKQWVDSPKAAHAITDSVSHNLEMLGGMIGFKVRHFKEYTGLSSWENMVERGGGYSVKGADQTLINNIIYPCFTKRGKDSIMQHYFLGMRNTYIDGYLTCICRADDKTYHNENCPLNIPLDIPDEFKATNDLCGHIGAAGYNSAPMSSFIHKYRGLFADLNEIEIEHKEIYYWTNENI